MREIRFISDLTEVDVLDVMLKIEKKAVIEFSLNYRAMIKDCWHEIYRVDNSHGFLHEHRFWISPDPIPLQEWLPMNLIVDKYVTFIKENFKKLRFYFGTGDKNENKKNEKQGSES